MNTYNIATVVTPNIFRSQELTTKDLLFAGTLVDVFIMMLNNL